MRSLRVYLAPRSPSPWLIFGMIRFAGRHAASARSRSPTRRKEPLVPLELRGDGHVQRPTVVSSSTACTAGRKSLFFQKKIHVSCLVTPVHARCVLTRRRDFLNMNPTVATDAAGSWECSNMYPAATPDAARSRECGTTARAPTQQQDGPRLALPGRRPNNRNLHHQHRHRPQTQLLFQATLSGVLFFNTDCTGDVLEIEAQSSTTRCRYAATRVDYALLDMYGLRRPNETKQPRRLIGLIILSCNLDQNYEQLDCLCTPWDERHLSLSFLFLRWAS